MESGITFPMRLVEFDQSQCIEPVGQFYFRPLTLLVGRNPMGSEGGTTRPYFFTTCAWISLCKVSFYYLYVSFIITRQLAVTINV